MIKRNLILTLVSISIALVSALAVAGVLNFSRSINTSGNVQTVGVEVYSDSACTQLLGNFDWGVVPAGGSVSKTIYVKNTGNSVVTLSISTTNWNPTSASSYITVSWNKGGSTLNPGSSTSAILTLSISSSITGITSFSVTVNIIGSG